MKKLFLLLLSVFVLLGLAACGTASSEDENKDSNSSGGETSGTEAGEEKAKLVVGATSVPHAEVLEEAKPLLAEKGVELEIEVYQDYILPNKDLDNGTLDANYFQHIPYLEQQMEEFGYDFVNLGGVHIEPMGIYSKTIGSLDEIKEGTVVIMSRSVADHGRILSLLEREGLIKLKDGVNKVEATVDDIDENKLDLEFDASIDAGLLPQFYEREEDALVVINTNYAIEAGLNPLEDALILEGSESPYVNIVASNAEDENDPALQTLIEVLQSEEIQTFIEETYEGAVVPVH